MSDLVQTGSPKRILFFLPVCILASVLTVSAQLRPTEPDPLERIRDAAKNNVVACSATGETLCEQVAPKIVANAEGNSAQAANLQRLVEAVKRQTTRSSHDEPVAIEWAVAAFREANVEAHTEKHTPLNLKEPLINPLEFQDVVAEIRGREKPEEWVLLGAHLDFPVPTLAQAYNAALVIEAARDIQLVGIRPRRSIRFVLFCPERRRMSSDYLREHRNELDRASGAIIFDTAANPVNGFVLNGRNDIQPGVKEALEPIYAMGITHHTFDAPLNGYTLDFILEGIPTLLAPGPEPDGPILILSADAVGVRPFENIDIQHLKRNTAIAAVAAFGIAERAEAIGPRQSRAEIESLLKATGLDEQMKNASIWPQWESGERGRAP